MAEIDELSTQFQQKFDQFLLDCNVMEQDGRWDTEELGEVEAFYTNDLMSVILRLIASDGTFTEKEVAYFDRDFGFQYTPDELSAIYESCSKDIENAFRSNFEDGLARLRELDPSLAASYGELVNLICKIISESDGVVASDELEEINALAQMVD